MRLKEFDAIRYAEANDLPLCKYNDPIEHAREDLTIAEANAVAREDAKLIYIDIVDDPSELTRDIDEQDDARTGKGYSISTPEMREANRQLGAALANLSDDEL